MILSEKNPYFWTRGNPTYSGVSIFSYTNHTCLMTSFCLRPGHYSVTRKDMPQWSDTTLYRFVMFKTTNQAISSYRIKVNIILIAIISNNTNDDGRFYLS